MKKVVASVLASSVLFLASPALAQTFASVSAGTDYVSRGTSQTDGGPAVTVYAEHQFSNGFYVAGFVANVDFLDSTDLEADLFAGHRGTLFEGVTYDAGVALITYHGGTQSSSFNPSGNWNMVEAKLALSHTTGQLTLGGTVAVTPDYFNNYGPSVWTEVTASYALTEQLSVSGAVGRQQFFRTAEAGDEYFANDSDPDTASLYPDGFPARYSDYNTWNVGASYSITPAVSVDVRYYDNDTRSYIGPIYDPRAVATLRYAF